VPVAAVNLFLVFGVCSFWSAHGVLTVVTLLPVVMVFVGPRWVIFVVSLGAVMNNTKGDCVCTFSPQEPVARPFVSLSTELPSCGMKQNIYEALCSSTYLKSSHVPRVSRVFETVLIALEEKLEEEPVNREYIAN
jgi:hypothetical protein